ncbi:hypothetical protein KAH37_05715 [bacterium]|nr:hypothetical protein [bacterium]
MRGPLFFLFGLLVIYVGWQASKPWATNYFLKSDLEAVAQYATKHGEEAVQKELNSVIIEKGYDRIISVETVAIEKDDDTDAVTLNAEYTDTMQIFGVEVTTVDFVISLQAAFVASKF